MDVSGSKLSNATVTKTDLSNVELRSETTGQWSGNDSFEFNNLGIALVTSATVDLYALRLCLKDRRPVIAYQLLPSGIPVDKNLITFPINKNYTKQGCLDGRKGLESDPDFLGSSREQSYYRPTEAYALKDRIEKEHAELQAEFETFQGVALLELKGVVDHVAQALEPGNASQRSEDLTNRATKYLTALPSRAKRNLANEFVWSAQGGFYSLSQETIDYRQTEVGSTFNYRDSFGGGIDFDNTLAVVATSASADLLSGLHANYTLTKDAATESTCQIMCDLPPCMDLRDRDASGDYTSLRKGAVTDYRFMTFYLEPDTWNTNFFFNQVVDPIWLAESQDLDAQALRSCSDKQNGRAWRIMHRVTYVQRALPIIRAPQDQQEATSPPPGLPSIDTNFQMLKMIAPHLSDEPAGAEMTKLKQSLLALYPVLGRKGTRWDLLFGVVSRYFDLTAPA